MEKIETEICAAIAKYLGRPVAEVTLAQNFEDDLNADSLDLAELMMELEEAYNITVAYKDLVKMQTVGDLVNYAAKAMDQSKPKLSKLAVQTDERSYKVNQVAKKLTELNLPTTAAAELVDFFANLDNNREM